jgi:hypothetical protein
MVRCSQIHEQLNALTVEDQPLLTVGFAFTNQAISIDTLRATSVAQLGVAALGKGWAIPSEPRL